MNADRHRSISSRNLKCYEHLRSKPQWSDWAMTVLFYVAHHELMAFLADQGERQPGKHGEMKDALKRPEWKHLADIHSTLLGYSHRARYFGGRFHGNQLDDAYNEVVKLQEAIAAIPKPLTT